MEKIYTKHLIDVACSEKTVSRQESSARHVTGVLNCPYTGVSSYKRHSVFNNEKRYPYKSVDVKFVTYKAQGASKACTREYMPYFNGSEKILGAFIFINSVRTGSLKSVFIYYDVSLNQVSNFNLHVGVNYYKQFQKFITNTLENKVRSQDIRQSDMKVVLAPVNYVNKSTIEEFKERNVEIILCKVTEQSLPAEISIIRRHLRNNLSTISDNESLANSVRTLNERLTDKGLLR